MKLTLAFAAMALLLQDQPSPGPERVLLSTREEMSCEIERYAREGQLIVKEGGKQRELPIEEVSRICFEAQPAITPEEGAQLRLQQGGLLTGKSVTYEAKQFTVDGTVGQFKVARADVRSLQLAKLDAAMPEAKDEKGDVLFWKPQGEEKELKAAYGELQTVTAESVVFKPGEGETITVARAEARLIYIVTEAKGGLEAPAAGWFAKVQFKNGDKLVGVLRAVDRESVVIFSHFLGVLSFKKALIHSVNFVQYAKLSAGNLLVCEQNGVREFDRTGKELWRYSNRVSYPWAARKLDNGNVLIANTNYNQVVEIKPNEKTGGDVVMSINNVNYPYDVRRLDNGHTLVAEFYNNRVAEYDAKGTVVWQSTKCSYPISAQRLDNGNTLMCSNAVVIEVDKDSQVKWQLKLPNLRPWRAERLDSGNTLVVDQQRGVVVEVDPQSKEVWKKDGLSRPNAAVRLDDGNTLILEQGNNRIIEVDPAGRVVGTIKDLSYPQHLSMY